MRGVLGFGVVGLRCDGFGCDAVGVWGVRGFGVMRGGSGCGDGVRWVWGLCVGFVGCWV